MALVVLVFKAGFSPPSATPAQTHASTSDSLNFQRRPILWVGVPRPRSTVVLSPAPRPSVSQPRRPRTKAPSSTTAPWAHVYPWDRTPMRGHREDRESVGYSRSRACP
ncbi:Hypothetical protein CAP_2468 [Chondromyces apiculatus DSM 436]|uniref:Uncharacterized protein n=1 Tax=Chondromyces apiculatus DSM 436 TaxID=1192034 RepID=A0A017T9R0_9BACT|nr:Hypothetical protein CAP_2468 [Chondromyces apiculatus DSM 436]